MSYRALAVLTLLAAPAACKKANSAAGGGPGGPGGFAMPVEVAAAIRDTVVDAIAATGQIEAIQSIELRPEVSGRITDILVREGQDVADGTPRSEEHTSELQSQSNLVCRLLLEKKKTMHPSAIRTQKTGHAPWTPMILLTIGIFPTRSMPGILIMHSQSLLPVTSLSNGGAPLD